MTLASGRGRNGSLGGLIYSATFNAQTTYGWFTTGGTGTRITGLRLAGPFNGPWRTDMEYHGFYVGHVNCEVDNNEWFGWNYAALEVLLGSNATTPYFHHNYIHHNTKLGCGYGICPGFNTGNVVPIVEGNIFDYERHSVAGHGTDGMSYEARYNLVLEHSISHVFDMHGGYDRGDGTEIAGTIIRVHHNTVRNTDQGAVCVRGIPTIGAITNNNWFYRPHDSWCIRQLRDGVTVAPADYVNFAEFNNQFGAPSYPGLYGEWNFDEGSGSTAADSSGRGHNGTLTNMNTTTSWVTGHDGTGLRFIDGSDYVDCGSAISQTDNIAFDCWVNFDSLPTYQELVNNGVFDLYYRGGTAGAYIWFRVRITSTTAYPGDSWWPSYSAIKSTVPIVTGQWYHYVGIRNGNTMTLYTNGALDRQLDCLAGYTVSTANATNLKFGQGTAGTLDSVSIYTPGYTPIGPTLTWTGESNYTDGGVNPKIGAASGYYTFRVKYSSPTGAAPMLGHPKLHLLRGGTEFSYFTPLVMNAVDLTTVTTGRIYQYQIKLPRGLDYSYCFEALDVNGAPATGDGCVPNAGLTIATGNNTPVMYYPTNDSTKYIENIVYPSSTTSNTNIDIRGAYMDIDNDPPMDGYPKVRIWSGTTEIAGSPFTMAKMETTDFFDRRNYQFLHKFAAGSYKAQVIAYDRQGTAAVGLPISAEAHPTVTDGGTMWCDCFSGATSPNPTMSFPVSVWFGQSTSNFVQGDVTVTNGSISGFTGSGGFYAFTVTATTQGTVTVNVPAGVCTGTSAGSNTASQTITMVCSSSGTPTTTNLATTAGSSISGNSFDVEVTFSQAVTGFTSGDVTVSNGSVSGFTGSGDSYFFNVTASGTGTVTVNVPAGVTSPSNQASNTLSVNCGPVTTSLATSATNPNASLSFGATVTFGSSVTGFDAGDITVTNGSVSGFSGSAASYAFNVTATTEGTVTLIIPAGMTSPSNASSSTISRVCYPATGANDIWVGLGYPGARLGTYTDPFDVMADGVTWIKSGGTMHVFSGANPETIRIIKPMRIQAYNGTAKIGAQ